ncbi:MAG: hypothetical protein KBT12_07905 [Bacteroidales bacterium]|nr:hypothetical protein [Candidatus Physcousia equi]
MRFRNLYIYLAFSSAVLCACGPSKEERARQERAEQERIEALAKQKADSILRVEQEKREEQERIERLEKEATEREAREKQEAVRPSGNSLRDREMRFYYDQGYDFGSHPTFSGMNDEWMCKAFLYVVSQHDMSHADNETLLRSFMSGVAQGRKELKDLQTY